ncbi:MAG: transglutaminase domain-containing protein [Paracoccaceae bacterium]
MVLADSDHPATQAKAQHVTVGAKTDREKLERLFLFVRDEIAFGFPKKGDLVPSSETIQTGMAQCNTKATLLLALFRASAIPARIHFSLIIKDIQRGFFSGIAYWLMPQDISHSWMEVEIERGWRRGWNVGFSLALSNCHASADLSIDKEAFEQMAVVTGDHGVWDDPSDYCASPLYQNRPGFLRMLAHRLMIGCVNRKVKRLRERSENHFGTDIKSMRAKAPLANPLNFKHRRNGRFQMKLFIFMALFLGVGTSVAAQNVGELLFKKNCVSCHGATGRGDGIRAAGLDTAPADLTRIAARRDGVWPMLEVISILDGYLKATNPREDMPIFEEFLDNDMVEFDTGNGLITLVPTKLVDIANYLETIQDPRPIRYVP